MVWQSWDDFFAMGGYGLYVWGALAATCTVMLGEPLALRLRRRGAVRAARMARAAGGRRP